jgi:alpha/beta superfamily hydrolase
MEFMKIEAVTETPFFFSNGLYKLFGMLYEPEIEYNNEGFVFCDPFAEEKLWAQRVMVNFARELAVRGYSVLRFDYLGTGDSEGDFEECSIETKLSDIRCAVRTLCEKVKGIKSIGLLGLRFGATLAVLAANIEKKVKSLVLWEPALNAISSSSSKASAT